MKKEDLKKGMEVTIRKDLSTEILDLLPSEERFLSNDADKITFYAGKKDIITSLHVDFVKIDGWNFPYEAIQELLEEQYDDFIIKGSLFIIRAFANELNNLGYAFDTTYVKNCNVFIETNCNGIVVNVKTKLWYGQMLISVKPTFILPEQFNKALKYAKEAAAAGFDEKDEFPKYVKWITGGNASSHPKWKGYVPNDGDCFEVIEYDKNHKVGDSFAGVYVCKDVRGRINTLYKSYCKEISKEDYAALCKKIKSFVFGNKTWDIANGVAESDGSYTIKLEDIEKALKWMSDAPTSNANHFTIQLHNGMEPLTLNEFKRKGKIGFGCCRDTYEKALEFCEELKESKKQ